MRKKLLLIKALSCYAAHLGQGFKLLTDPAAIYGSFPTPLLNIWSQLIYLVHLKIRNAQTEVPSAPCRLTRVFECSVTVGSPGILVMTVSHLNSSHLFAHL